MGKFRRDLEKGQQYEKIALSYFKYEKVYFPKGKCKEYDFILDDKIKIEVKSDRLASTTGNLAIEYKCNGKPSGIFASEADYYIYFINYQEHDDCYKIPLKDLKDICRKQGRKISGGDGNRIRMYLVKKEHFINYLIQEKYPSSYIRPKTFDMATEKSKSYTDQLIDHLRNDGINQMDKITESIAKFKFNYAKKKEEEKENAKPGYITFGKYKGKTIKDVANFDKGYLRWLLKQEWFSKFEELSNEAKELIK